MPAPTRKRKKREPPTPELVNRQAKATDKFLDRTIRNDQKYLEEAIQNLERTIADRLAELQTKGDKLLGPRVNLKQAVKAHKELKQLFEETYMRAVRGVVGDFDEIAAFIESQWHELDPALTFTGIDSAMIEQLKTATYDEYAKYGMDAQTRVARAMYQSIAAQVPVDNLRSVISSIFTGEVDKRGRPMTTYATNYTFDATMQFHRAVNLKKAEDAGFDHFKYVGSIIGDSRDFCRQRAGRIFSRKEIESWDFDWQGKSGPALTNCGGYNCRHHWQPVDMDWYEGEDVTVDEIASIEKESA
jgi:hypothetical protein